MFVLPKASRFPHRILKVLCRKPRNITNCAQGMSFINKIAPRSTAAAEIEIHTTPLAGGQRVAKGSTLSAPKGARHEGSYFCKIPLHLELHDLQGRWFKVQNHASIYGTNRKVLQDAQHIFAEELKDNRQTLLPRISFPKKRIVSKYPTPALMIR